MDGPEGRTLPQRKERLVMWLVAWTAAALTIVGILRPGEAVGFWVLALLVPYFPIGLFPFLKGSGLGAAVIPMVVAGWLLYAAVTTVFFKARSETRFWAAGLLLCALLTFNVYGCRQFL